MKINTIFYAFSVTGKDVSNFQSLKHSIDSALQEYSQCVCVCVWALKSHFYVDYIPN